MANKTEELNVDLTIKQVSSDDVLKNMEENNQLEANEIILTKTDTEVPMMPVGSIFASAIPITDARVHLLDGSTISQTGVYETFANLIKALEASGQPITCTQTEFDADVSTYGQCGKFVIDNTAKTIRLPRITEFIASNNGGQTIGLAQLDEFKSHNHAYYGWATVTDGSGSYPVAGDSQASTNTSHTTRDRGGSETRPKNIRYPYYIVIARGYKSSQVVDVDNIMNEVNAKLPLTGGTMTGVMNFENVNTTPINIYNSSGDTVIRCKRTDTGNSLTFGIGGGGVNRGIWDEVLNYWLFYTDGNKTYLKGQATRPEYNSSDLALLSDTVSNRGYMQIAGNQTFTVQSGTYFVVKLSQGNSITMTTSGRGALAVRGSIYCKISSGTIWVALYIDGAHKGDCLGIHTSNMYMPLNWTVTGLSAGTHTVELKCKGNNSGSTITIPNYSYTNIYLWEY